jgi:phosphoglycerate dehydrogenase-like enzyme
MDRRTRPLHAFLARDAEVREPATRLAREASRELVIVDDPGGEASAAALEAALPEIELLVCRRAPRGDVDWSFGAKLRLLHFLGAGTDGLFPARGLRAEVVVANTRGMHADAMRDHVLAMILAFERELLRVVRQQAEARWERFAAGSVAGRTLAVVGLGAVGRPIASAAAMLGMKVLGVKRTPGAAPAGVTELFTDQDLGDVLARADYVVVTVPLTPETRGMIGRPEIARLGPNAVVVDVSRGGVVDEGALTEALASRRIRGAALDVFATEPLAASSPLWALPNVIITPHVAGWMPGYMDRAFAIVLDNVARFERGEPVRTPVDRAQEY